MNLNYTREVQLRYYEKHPLRKNGVLEQAAREGSGVTISEGFQEKGSLTE